MKKLIYALLVWNTNLFISSVPINGMRVNKEMISQDIQDIEEKLIKDTMDSIARVQNIIQNKEKHILMVLGTTGVGKGTLINYLNNIELTPVFLNSGWKLEAKSTLPDISISHSKSESDTFYPAIYTSKENPNNIFSYIDTPGFKDTRGAGYDIAAAYFRQEIINKADFIKIILMLPYEDFTSEVDRGVRINSQIKTLAQFLQLSENREYINQLKNAISLVVTQVDPPRFSVNELKNRLEKKRAEHHNNMLILMPDAQKRSNFIETKLLKNDIEEYNQALQEVEYTPAHHKNVIKSFFNEQINLDYIEKDIVNHLLSNSNFELFSKPIVISYNKAEMVSGEKEKILKLIDKTQYINIKENRIKIGLPISDGSKIAVISLANHVNAKIKEETHNSIPAIIQYCKEQIDRSNSYSSLRKILQSKRDDLIKIINSSDKENFLKNIKGKISRELEIKKNIEYLDFFSQLNNSIKYAVDSWSTSLHGIKNQIEALLRSPTIELRNNILKVTGVLVSGTEVFNSIKSYDVVKELQIFAFNTMFLDHDFENLKLKGLSIMISAPSWKIIGNIIIDISGKNGQSHKPTKASNAASVSSPGTDGNDGTDGLPGNPGSNGGNFLGIGQRFYNLNQLTINVSGGKGGTGQDGGDGGEGIDGSDAPQEPVLNRDQQALLIRKELTLADKKGINWLIHGAKKLSTFNSQFREIYLSEGMKGGKGGNAGKGGAGGNGGFPGNCKLYPQDFRLIEQKGANGEDGRAGIAGIGGKSGQDYIGEYISEEVFPGIRGKGEKLLKEAEAESKETKEATKTATIAIKTATPAALAAAAAKSAFSLGQGLAYQAVASIVSSYLSSGWDKKEIKTNSKAADGIQPTEKNKNEIQFPEKRIVFNSPAYEKEIERYYNWYYETAPDFVDKNTLYVYSFLVLNLMRSAEICYSSSELSEYPQKRVLETIVKRYPIAMPLSVIESSEGYIKTKSQKPINTARKQNAATFSISATAIKESSSSQEGYKEKNNGCDGRRKIEKTDEWPYSVHGTVFASFSNGEKKWGTGTLIAPNLVLTAAHNLYDMDYDVEKMRESTKVEFCPAMNGDKIFFGNIEIIKHYFPKEYKISGDTSFDYGLLVLNRPVGQETGYFGLGIISEDKLKSVSINVTGYPGDKVPDKSGWYEMWTMEGPIKNIQDGLINYTINTYSGQSGAGIWYQDRENYLVAGVHVKGATDFNSAVLLTKERYEKITEWVKDSVLQTIDKSLPSLSFPNVTRLDLSEEKIGDIEMRLFTSDRFPRLTRLNLRDNKISDIGAQALAKNTNLTELDLWRNNIGTAGAQALALNTTLTKLNLEYNNIGEAGIQAFTKNTILKQLYLGGSTLITLSTDIDKIKLAPAINQHRVM